MKKGVKGVAIGVGVIIIFGGGYLTRGLNIKTNIPVNSPNIEVTAQNAYVNNTGYLVVNTQVKDTVTGDVKTVATQSLIKVGEKPFKYDVQ